MVMVLVPDNLWLIVYEECERSERPLQYVQWWNSDVEQATANVELALHTKVEWLEIGIWNAADFVENRHKLYIENRYCSHFFICKMVYKLMYADHVKQHAEISIVFHFIMYQSLH